VNRAAPKPVGLSPRSQQGVALIVVLTLLLLSLLSVLGALRLGWLGESMVGNEADYQRTRVAAEAVLRDAMIDVAGFLPDGEVCLAGQLEGGCRSKALANPVWVPRNSEELQLVRQNLEAAGAAAGKRLTEQVPCWQGLCVPATTTSIGPLPTEGGNWWEAADTLSALSDPDRSAHYGEFSGARADAGDPILSDPARARYWVEIFPYTPSASVPDGVQAVESTLLPTTGRTLQAGDSMKSVVYRITAIANGLRAGTRVVLRAVVVSVIQRDV
jgi:type IV pilus assembly protein PilX